MQDTPTVIVTTAAEIHAIVGNALDARLDALRASLVTSSKPKPPKVYLTARQASEVLGVHVRTLKRYAKAGKIIPHTYGRTVRYDEQDVYRLLDPVSS